MSGIKRFEDMECWQKARQFANSIYIFTNQDRCARDFALKDQLRRASISILSNIAEGFERDGNKEFVQFLSIAKGSCGEIRAQLHIALDQGYLSANDFDSLSTSGIELSRMLSGFIKYLRNSEFKGRKFSESGT